MRTTFKRIIEFWSSSLGIIPLLNLTFNYKSIKLVLQWFVHLSLVMIFCLFFSLFLLFLVLGASFELSVLIAHFVTSDKYNVHQKNTVWNLIESKSSACSLLIPFSKHNFFSIFNTYTHKHISSHVMQAVRGTWKINTAIC